MQKGLQRKSFRLKEEGGTLITVLVFSTVLLALVGSLLEITSQEYKLSKRSLSWNQALYTAEAGIEKGWNEMNRLTAINTNGSFMTGWSYVSNNTWSLTSQTLTPLAGSDYSSTYTVSVTTNSPAGQSTIQASGTTSSALLSQNVTRNLRVVLTPVTPFNFAILTKTNLNFNGNSATLDSWKSSTTGDYNVANQRAHGNIGTDGLVINTAGLALRGSPSTGPGGNWSGTAPIQPVAPDTGTNYFTADTQVSIPDAKVPFTAGMPTAPVNVTVAGDYSFTSISGGQTFGSTSGAGGIIRVYVSGNISVGGNTSVKILQPAPPSTARYTVQLYVAGSIDFSGTEDTNVTAGSRAAEMQIYGLPTCTSVNISGNCKTQAAIYAPNASVRINGGGHEAFYGSIVANDFTANGGIDFHYDESLAGTGNVTSYNLAQWIEY